MPKAAPTPTPAMTTPASAGPTARARLNSMPLRADAAARSCLGTRSGRMARQLGASKASPAAIANVRRSRSQGDVAPARVRIVSTTAKATIQASVNRISRRRSTMSPIAPAGRASRRKGSDDAVCVSATNVAPAPNDTMSHAAPTLCMNAPMSDARLARSRLRNVLTRRGAARLGTGDLVAAEDTGAPRDSGPGLGGSHRHDRARSGGDHSRGDAAQEHARGSSASVRPHDDQVDAVLFGRFDDRLVCETHEDQPLGLDALLPRVLHQRL